MGPNKVLASSGLDWGPYPGRVKGCGLTVLKNLVVEASQPESPQHCTNFTVLMSRKAEHIHTHPNPIVDGDSITWAPTVNQSTQNASDSFAGGAKKQRAIVSSAQTDQSANVSFLSAKCWVGLRGLGTWELRVQGVELLRCC